MDHVYLHNPNTNDHPVMFGGSVLGVVDHCTFDTPGFGGMFLIRHNRWKGVADGCTNGCGHYSWTQPLNLGSQEFLFIEDCTFSNMGAATAVDGDGGARIVFRHNTVNKANIGGHGSDTGLDKDLRGTRVIDIYCNQFHASDSGGTEQGFAIHVRSGTRYVHNNIFNSMSGNSRGYDEMINMDFHRLYQSNGVWSLANGSNPWDHTSNGQNISLLDQPCSGTGDMLKGNGGSGNPVINTARSNQSIWPRNAREPIYAWANNSYGGGNSNGQKLVSYSALVSPGVDFFTQGHEENGGSGWSGALDMVDASNYCTTGSVQGGNIVPAGYTTFTYPHPLVSGAPTAGSTPGAPTNLRVVN
jgi:hypothetical protein